MTHDVRVSVVMPVHNAAAYVGAAVRSALASDLRELEVIVVDDGSQDHSASIVAAIADPRVMLLRTPPSGGPSRPRNIGVTHARGDYIAFLDSDDVLKPGKLSAAVNALDRHPQVGLAFTDFESIDEHGKLLRKSVLHEYMAWPTLTSGSAEDDWHIVRQAALARALVYENFIGTSGVVLDKRLLADVGGFDESLRYSEDRDLWFRIAHRCDALFCSHVGHAYRVRPGSLSDSSQMRNAKARISVLYREKSRWERGERAIHRQIDSLVATNLAAIAYEERDHNRLRAMAMFARAFALSPRLQWLRGLFGSILG